MPYETNKLCFTVLSKQYMNLMDCISGSLCIENDIWKVEGFFFSHLLVPCNKPLTTFLSTFLKFNTSARQLWSITIIYVTLLCLQQKNHLIVKYCLTHQCILTALLHIFLCQVLIQICHLWHQFSRHRLRKMSWKLG